MFPPSPPPPRAPPPPSRRAPPPPAPGIPPRRPGRISPRGGDAAERRNERRNEGRIPPARRTRPRRGALPASGPEQSRDYFPAAQGWRGRAVAAAGGAAERGGRSRGRAGPERGRQRGRERGRGPGPGLRSGAGVRHLRTGPRRGQPVLSHR